eukprot:9866276-Karenia_brevis.AAC.1
MRKTYCAVIVEMRSDPSLHVLSVIDNMAETLATMCRDFQMEGPTHLIRLISRSKEDRVEDLYVPGGTGRLIVDFRLPMTGKEEPHWQ